ncbi:MAG: gliding motility protein GldC [Chitinophagales bacterium]
MKTSQINIAISLDETNIPSAIRWEATDAEPGKHEATAMLLAFWDQQTQNGLSIDLWTKNMTIPEMNIFLYQTMLSLSDTFHRATQDKLLSDEMKKFANEFWEKVRQK